jgi:hypothetical protein
MKSLRGLWKNESERLLVHLHGAEVRSTFGPRRSHSESFEGSFEAVVRVVKGDGTRLQAATLMLISVLPKQPISIQVIDASPYVGGKSDMWNISAVAFHESAMDDSCTQSSP